MCSNKNLNQKIIEIERISLTLFIDPSQQRERRTRNGTSQCVLTLWVTCIILSGSLGVFKKHFHSVHLATIRTANLKALKVIHDISLQLNIIDSMNFKRLRLSC